MSSPSDQLQLPPTPTPTETLNPTPQPPPFSMNILDSPHQASTADEDPQREKRKRDDMSAPEQSTGDPSLHTLYKTSLCSYFRRDSGSCSHGSQCRYAHGEEELRPRPDNTWDPTSERAKKVIKLDNGDAKSKDSREDGIMMTDDFVDDVDGDGPGGCLNPELSKCLVHLPRRWTSDNLRNFLRDQGIHFKSAKKKKGMTVGFVSFESTERLESAIEELEGKQINSNKIKVADVIPRSYDKKIKLAMDHPHDGSQVMESILGEENKGFSQSSDCVQHGDGNDEGLISKPKSARDAVTPLAHKSYDEQLQQKKNSIAQMLKKLTRSARKACPNGVSLPEWILKSREIGGLPCQLEGILQSPLINGYRNKCEFSVGYSLQGKPTVGFMLGNFRAGVTAVEEPVDCPNVSSIACKYALIFQEFLQHSNLPMWNRFKNTGFWRLLTVREGRLPGNVTTTESPVVNISEVMLIVQVCTVGFDDVLITTEYEKLANAFVTGAAANSPPLPLTALVLQDHQGISNVAPHDAPLNTLPLPNAKGGSEVEQTRKVVEARIHDHINNLRFSISPTAFFQVNTLAAEKLYSLAGDWAGLGPDTLLFDICCGTGTIGLTLAHRVGLVVGIEMNASAVSDANRNAEINGIKNCRFVCAKAEDVMASLLKEYLIVTRQQDKLGNGSGSSNNDIDTPEEIDVSSVNVLEADGNSSHEHKSGEGDSGNSSHEYKSSEDDSGFIDDGQESQNHIEKNCTSQSGSSVREFKNLVAIVDPPRGGLHPIVIKALRTNTHLQRLVYISCNPETLVANAIELCTPSADKVEKGNKKNRGWRNMSSAGLARHRVKSMPVSEPFRPVKAMAVDLFPHTTHCEMVMLLER